MRGEGETSEASVKGGTGGWFVWFVSLMGAINEIVQTSEIDETYQINKPNLDSRNLSGHQLGEEQPSPVDPFFDWAILLRCGPVPTFLSPTHSRVSCADAFMKVIVPPRL